MELVRANDPYCKDIFSEYSAPGKYGGFRKKLYVHEKDGNREAKKKLISLEIILLKNKYDLIGYFLKGIILLILIFIFPFFE